jgi:pilus assembly protein Flp/PilA
MSNTFRAVLLRAGQRFDDESGQGMIEYGLLVALISIAAIAVIVFIGPQLTTIFGNVVNAL